MKDPRDIFRQFSTQAKKVLTASQQVAESMKTGIGSEHMLIALTLTPQTAAYEVLKEAAITLEQIRLVLSLHPAWTRATRPGLRDDAKHILQATVRQAARFGNEQIEAEHLLLAIVSLPSSRGYQIIARVGVDPNHLKRQLEELIAQAHDLKIVFDPKTIIDDPAHHHHHIDEGSSGEEQDDGDEQLDYSSGRELLERPPVPTERRGKMLELFGTDLTNLAKVNQLDPVIGRDDEIVRTIQILARRTKNNPVLIGEPGVGKTAIAEGLAHRLVTNQVPLILQQKRLVRLDLGLLVAGTMYRGQFEERMKRLIDEIKKDSNLIIFIDEIHTVVGTGSAEGSMDAANMLKPALARGQIRVIGATTLDDYRKVIEKDPALERRFQSILVHEPTIDATRTILEGLRSKYEEHHRVHFGPDALATAVTLAHRYIMDRALPDKAIDVMDEAAAAKQIHHPSKSLGQLTKFGHQLEQTIRQKERAIEREAFDAAARLRTKELTLRTKIRTLEDEQAKHDHRHYPVVTREDIARVVAQTTGIPLSHLIRTERTDIRHLEERLNHSLVGQETAVKSVVAAIRRAEARINPSGRPLGSFLFLGPTGVGKTELARLLAREVFGSEKAFVKIDMSDFMERHALARLTGAPPGYVGYDEGGKLTEAVRRRPFTLLLLDEIEKAHPETQNLLLQILEDGLLTDAKGRRVSFANTIIILTSNLGSNELNRAQAIGFRSNTSTAQPTEAYDALSARVLEGVKRHFRPEFLNRLDSQLVFQPLTPPMIRTIVDLRLGELVDRLAQEGYHLRVTDGARDQIAHKGFDPEYGARPIRRLLTEWIENPLAEQIVNQELKPGTEIRVTQGESQVELHRRTPKKSRS